MKKLWLLLLMVMPLQLIHAQEVKHAPTVEQCQADQKLWLSQATRIAIDPIASTELAKRAKEMKECRAIDPTFSFQYYNTSCEINAEQMIRLMNFLKRHNLLSQYWAEDAQGCRGSEPCKP